MIVELGTRPAVFWNIEPDGNRFLSLHLDNGTQYGLLALESFGTNVNVHLEVFYWTPRVLKRMIADWPKVVAIAVDMGAICLLAINRNYNDKRWPKLIKHFGFPQPATVAISHQEVKHG